MTIFVMRLAPGSFAEVYRRLLHAYGDLHWWPAETPDQVAIGAILTQNTSWKNVERAMQNLISAGLDRLDA